MASRQSIRERKRQLSATLADCRQGIRPRGLPLKRGVHPLQRLRSRLGGDPLKIFGLTFAGAALLALVFRPRRRKKRESETSPHLLFRWILGISQPAFKLWVLHKAKEHFVNTSPSKPPESLPHR